MARFIEHGVGLTESFTDAAPEMAYRRSRFDAPVSVTENGDLVSFGQVLATFLPDSATKLGLQYESLPDGIKRYPDLTLEDRALLTFTRYTQHRTGNRLAIRGQGDYSFDDIMHQIRQRTEVGQRMIDGEMIAIALDYVLVEKGKITGIEEDEPSGKNPEAKIVYPEFPF